MVKSLRKLSALIFAWDRSEDRLCLLPNLLELSLLVELSTQITGKFFFSVELVFRLGQSCILLTCGNWVLVVSAIIVNGPIKLRGYLFDRPDCIKMPIHVIIFVVLVFQSSKLVCHVVWLLSILGQEWSFERCSIDGLVFRTKGLHALPVTLNFRQKNIFVTVLHVVADLVIIEVYIFQSGSLKLLISCTSLVWAQRDFFDPLFGPFDLPSICSIDHASWRVRILVNGIVRGILNALWLFAENGWFLNLNGIFISAEVIDLLFDFCFKLSEFFKANLMTLFHRGHAVIDSFYHICRCTVL